MIGTTLREIRAHVESLASDAGEFYLVCGRTGDRPHPATGLRFDDRTTARAAAGATEQYRTALRRYDPGLPRYDVIVCQDVDPRRADPGVDCCGPEDPDRGEWSLSAPVVEGATTDRGDRSREGPRDDPRGDADARPTSDAREGPTTDRRDRVEFCHRVAAAVFESLSERGADAVESSVMGAYFDLAETRSDPDDLCLCLLESMAAELDERLDPTEQAELLAAAGRRLGPADPGPTDAGDPVPATFALLEEHGLLAGFERASATAATDGGPRSVAVDVSGYALSPRGGRLPVFPIAFECYRRGTGRDPSALRVTEVDGGWRVTVSFGDGTDPDGLVSAPIRSGG